MFFGKIIVTLIEIKLKCFPSFEKSIQNLERRGINNEN